MSDEFGNLEEGASGMGQGRGFAIDQAQLAMDPEFLDWNAHQFAAGEFIFNADFRKESDAIAEGNKTFDRLQSGKLDSHVQWSLIFFECLDDFFPIRRAHDMRDKRLGPELADAHPRFASEWVLRWNHEDEFVGVDNDRSDLGVLGIVGQDSELSVVAADVVGQLASEGAKNRNANGGMQAAKLSKG